jgi:hypothetical protein
MAELPGLQGEERPREALIPAPLTALLAERECGPWRPPALERVVKEARARDVRLSGCRDIDPPFPGCEVSSMAIDEVEYRYLLCGFADGSLAIVDVEERPGAQPSNLRPSSGSTGPRSRTRAATALASRAWRGIRRTQVRARCWQRSRPHGVRACALPCLTIRALHTQASS